MPYNHDATWAEQAAAPSTPSTGNWKLYPKADGFFAVDDAGTEYGPFSSETVALLTAATELTISSGAVTITQSHHTIDTQADAASDDLDTINGGLAGELLYIRAENDARTVVLKHGTGNVVTPNSEDVTLSSVNQYALLVYDGTNSQWVVINLTGDLDGPASSTDNAIARFDGTAGKLLQNSGVTVDDSDNVSLGGAELRNYATQVVTASPATPYAIDWAAASIQEITLGQNTTFTFANLAAGRRLTVVLIQDGTGSRTVTWPASVDWPGGVAPTLSTAAAAVDVFSFVVRADGATVLGFADGLDMG